MQETLKEYFLQLFPTLRESYPDVDLPGLAVGSLFTFLATAVLILLFRLVGRLSLTAKNKVIFWEGTRIRSLSIQQQELLRSHDLVRIINSLIKVFHWLILICLFYLYLNFVFSLFPATRGWAATLLEYAIDAVLVVGTSILGYVPNLIFILVIAVVASYIIKLARLVFDGIGEGRITIPGFFQDWSKPTFNITRFLIIVFAAIVIIPYLPGSGSSAFQGVSIFFGLLLSLGSTAAVANVVAGTVITYMRAFRIGDRVRIADTIGDVTEKTLFVTRIRTIKNVDVTIPNAMVLANHIVNFSTLCKEGEGLILHTAVTLGYDVPWRKVHDLLVEAASATEGVEEDPKPFVLQTSLDDFYVTYELNGFTHCPEAMAVIYSNLHQNIQDKFHEAGIEITSPHYSAIRDGNQAAIPADYLPRNYQPPAFKIHPFEGLFSFGRKKKAD
jgi:small-conductance mechanosensitive channel